MQIRPISERHWIIQWDENTLRDIREIAKKRKRRPTEVLSEMIERSVTIIKELF